MTFYVTTSHNLKSEICFRSDTNTIMNINRDMCVHVEDESTQIDGEKQLEKNSNEIISEATDLYK